MDEEINTFELMEPASPEALVPTIGMWPWMLAAGILAVLAVIILILIKRRKPASASLALQRTAAFSEATSALDNLPTGSSREAAVLTSLILRKYLSAAANDPALFETHEEFVTRHDSLKSLTPEARAAADTGFSRLASLKYAPEIPSAESTEVIADSRALLETLHRGFAA